MIIRYRMRRLLIVLISLISLGLLPTACSTDSTAVSSDLPSIDRDAEYSLGVGDRLRVTLFGDEQVSREVEVDSGGRITLPLIGDIDAAGRSTNEVRDMIVDTLKPDYYANPMIGVEVLEYRDFFIIGEVADPGPYPYRGKMTVITGVAMAGGFTYRAVEDEFIISRDGKAYRGGKENLVLPGDVIEVKERYF